MMEPYNRTNMCLSTGRMLYPYHSREEPLVFVGRQPVSTLSDEPLAKRRKTMDASSSSSITTTSSSSSSLSFDAVGLHDKDSVMDDGTCERPSIDSAMYAAVHCHLDFKNATTNTSTCSEDHFLTIAPNAMD